MKKLTIPLAAGAPFLFYSSDLDAVITSIDPVELTGLGSANLNLSFNLDAGSKSFSPFLYDSGGFDHDIVWEIGGTGGGLHLGAPVGAYQSATPYSAGETIDSNDSFTSINVYLDSDLGPTLYAMQFSGINDGETHYGWLEMDVNYDIVDDSVTLSILSGAYQSTPDTAINAGAIPEPADFALGLGALALGATVVRQTRRKRHNCKA